MDGEIEAAASDPTTGRRSGRNGAVQVIARMSVKRAWTTSQKMAILDEAFAPSASVSKVAERQLYTWRRLLLEGSLAGPRPAAQTFARVAMTPAIMALPGPAPVSVATTPTEVEPMRRSGLIEIEPASGIRIRVDGDVNCKALKRSRCAPIRMISIPAGVRIYLACGHTDMRRGFDGLALMVQEVLAQDPYSGALFIFRGKRGSRVT